MIIIWNKEKISKLTSDEKRQWFEVLNYRLEEDRNISPSDPLVGEKQKEIRDDYFRYLDSCATDKNFYKYYVLMLRNKIISVCRINVYENKYLLEGLQTHKDYFRKGYASKLIVALIQDIYKDGIETLFSEARTWNVASNQLQQKIGFIQYGQDELNYLYRLDVKAYNNKSQPLS